MNGRRGFMAFLGGAGVTGLATTRASVARPTLILPPGIVPAVSVPEFPLLMAQKTRMHAMFACIELLPTGDLDQWLEAGLQMGERYRNGPLRVDSVPAFDDPGGECRA